MKYIHILFVAIMAFIGCACTRVDVNFSYSPAAPCVGRPVTFTNTTTEGEKWEWSFGDGSSSSSKNPSKTYKRPGTYVVTLKVDGKNSLVCTKTLEVRDSVPSLMLSAEPLYIFHPVQLRAGYYNPYNKQVTCTWQLPSEAVVLEGSTESERLVVCFSSHMEEATLTCHLTLGEENYDLQQTVCVRDTLAPGLKLYTQQDEYLVRLFTLGAEQPVRLGANTVANFVHDRQVGGKTYSLTADGIYCDGTLLIAGTIRMFEVDALARKIYYTTGESLRVANINASSDRVLVASGVNAYGLAVDNAFNRLYYTTTGGVDYLPLVQSVNNASEATPVSLVEMSDLEGLELDATPRLCPQTKH